MEFTPLKYIVYIRNEKNSKHNQPCECTDNLRIENYLCTIFAVLITFYVNSRLNGFQDIMVFMTIVFLIHGKTFSKENIF